MEKQVVHKIEISHRTIVFTVLFLLFLWLLYQIRDTLLTLLVGIILVSAINPLVEQLEKIKIPRIAAIILVYLIIFSFFGLLLAGIIPPFISQTQELISRLPSYYNWIANEKIISSQLDNVLKQLGSVSFNLAKILTGIFGNFIYLFVLVFVSFYLLLERKNLDNYFLKFFGEKNGKQAIEIFNKIELRLGEWVGAQVILMLIIGIMTFIGLRLLGIEYALSLALFAGVLEVIPNIGPTIAAIPAVLTGLAISPLMGLSIVALYFLIQQIENHFIVPQVMKREIGINPLITILSLLAGFKIGGILGAILALPFLIILETVLKEIPLLTQKN